MQRGPFSSTHAKTYINVIKMCQLANTNNIKNKNTYYNDLKTFNNNKNDINKQKIQTTTPPKCCSDAAMMW